MGWLKKKKKPQDKLLKLLGDAMKDANENAQKVQNAIFHKQRPYSDDFGLCEQNPIFTSSLTGTEQYLSKVCTNKWEKFTWNRCRSIRATVGGQQDVSEDVYTLYLNGEAYTELYFVMYCGESEAPPAGLYFYGDSTDWDIRREAYSKGVTVNQLVEIQQMEAEEKFLKEKAERELKQAVERKSQPLKNKYPDASVETELQDQTFSFLASVDVDLLVAYEYVHKDELLFKKKSMTMTTTECATAESFFDVMHQLEYDEKQKDEADHRETVDDLQREAARRGISILQMIDQTVKIQIMKEEYAKHMWEMRVEELQEFANQAIVVQSFYQNFNLREDWTNIAFRKITEKFGMLIAYEILHFSECYSQEVQREVVSEYPHMEAISEETQNELVSAEKSVVETALFCRKCGAKLMLDSAFCYKCGVQVVISE